MPGGRINLERTFERLMIQADTVKDEAKVIIDMDELELSSAEIFSGSLIESSNPFATFSDSPGFAK